MVRRSTPLVAVCLSLFAVTASGQVVCPPIQFLTAYSVDAEVGPATRLLEREPDGRYSARVYRWRLPLQVERVEIGFGDRFTRCAATPPPGGPPIAPASKPLGAGSTSVLYIPDVGNGAPAGAWTALRGDAVWIFEGTVDRALSRRTEYPVASRRGGMLSDDYDGDGFPDIAVIVQTADLAGGVAILGGNGDGTFRPAVTRGGLPETSSSMAQSDFNGDGAIDLAVTAANSGSIQILLGEGDGSFRDGQKLETVGPFAVSAGDVDGDGEVDLVAGSDVVTVFLGKGDGRFGAGASFPAGGSIRYIALGDLDEDGNVDIVAAHQQHNSVSVLGGSGNGAFGAPRSYAGPLDVDSLVLVDFNQDGHLDVAAATGQAGELAPSQDSTQLGVLLGRGDLTLAAAPAFLEDRETRGLAIGDLNGDGLQDVAVAENGPQIVAFLQNPGGGLDRVASDSGGSMESVALADFNGDGRLDAAGYARNRGLVRLLGNGDGSFQAAVSTPLPGGVRGASAAASDFTGDGAQDLVLVAQDGSPGLLLATGDGNGGFSVGPVLSAGVRPNSLAVGDVDGDGRPDVVVGDPGFGTDPEQDGVFLLRNNGAGEFAPAARIRVGLLGNRPTLADVNGDFALDLLVSAQGENFTSFWAVLLNNGTGSFTETERIATGFGPGQIAAADFSRDGRIDVSLLHCCGDVRSGLFLGNGDGTFQNETFHDVGADPLAQIASDLDGDGAPDLALLGTRALTILRNISRTDKPFVNVSGASFHFGPAAPESIVTAFGAGLAARREAATSVPLPTQLGGASGKIVDAAGAERDLQMFFADPNQINYLIPPGLASGRAVVSFQPQGGAELLSDVEIAPVAPSVFVADGARTAAALLLRVRPDGEQIVEPVVEIVNGAVVPRAIDFGAEGDRLFLLLFATGLRGAGRVDLRIDGRFLPVAFFGPQGAFVGLDQVNAELVPELAGSGLVSVDLFADDIFANATQLLFR